MFRLIITCSLCIALGYYVRDYDLLTRFSPKAQETIIQPIKYNQKLTRSIKLCSIVRPADYEESVIKISEDRQIYDDFTTKQLSIENKTSNSKEIYCYLSVDTEEYKLTSAVRNSMGNSCYKEIYKFEARDSFKYGTMDQNYQIQRICCAYKGNNGYAACRMTNWLSEQTEYSRFIGIWDISHYLFFSFLATVMFIIGIVGLVRVFRKNN